MEWELLICASEYIDHRKVLLSLVILALLVADNTAPVRIMRFTYAIVKKILRRNFLKQGKLTNIFDLNIDLTDKY